MTPTLDHQPDEFRGLTAAEMAPLVAVLASAAAPARRVRGRLLDRVAQAVERSSGLLTRRHARMPVETPEPGVMLRRLHASSAVPLRPGEPRRAQWVELAPGASWTLPPETEAAREWLVLRGDARLGHLKLGELDYFRGDASMATVSTDVGATLYVRSVDAAGRAQPRLSQDAPQDWEPYGPGILRRVLWTDGGQAAMLYRTLAGAAVPHHAHVHDEECLMVDGDLFVDDLLLRAGDYQLAPAGTEHGSVSTDTGCLLFAHGDLELAVRI